MLLRFTVENLFCFAEETVFSMVATKDEQHPEHSHLLRDGYPHKALRIASLYGANAHGKTKLVQAMEFARELIIEGSRPGRSISVKPFRLDGEKRKQPSRCEFVIFHNDVEYTYGFVVDSTRIVEEWLFVRVDGQEECYFERGFDEQRSTSKIRFGEALKQKEADNAARLEFVAQGTRDNQLFLTKAMDDNVSTIKPVYEWFDDILTIVPTQSTQLTQRIALKACKDTALTDFMGDFLRLAGTGIDSLITQEKKMVMDDFMSSLPEHVRQHVEDNLAKNQGIMISMPDGPAVTILPGELGPTVVDLKAQHLDNQGNLIAFSLEDESSGTLRLIEMLPILASLKGGGNEVYIIDELDRKLHPLLSRLYVETFLEKSKGLASQLIFTTHETSLLNLDLLRRDEIWFVEKDRKGASQLYSLADFDFKPNPDLKLERGYLHGRFGGIPFIGDIQSLGW